MKTRQEYENLMDTTFILSGDAKSDRIKIDLLLDIRELLMWFKEKELYEQTVEARQTAERVRISKSIEALRANS